MPTLTQSEIAQLEHDLVAQGWTRQFTVFPNRVQEFVDLYGAMGLEVRIEPWALTFHEDVSCDNCGVLGVVRTIFTRRKIGS
jgi:hypothetical protein